LATPQPCGGGVSGEFIGRLAGRVTGG